MLWVSQSELTTDSRSGYNHARTPCDVRASANGTGGALNGCGDDTLRFAANQLGDALGIGQIGQAGLPFQIDQGRVIP